MEPFGNFGHFIAYFVPGIVIATAATMGGSLLANANLFDMGDIQNLIVILVLATILGLFLDELRHVRFEAKLEQSWAEKRRYDLAKIGDPLIYSKEIGLDVYQQIVNDYYYFYEFDLNIAVALAVNAVIAPFFLTTFYNTNDNVVIVFAVISLFLAFAFYKFGIQCYEYFLDLIVKAVAKADGEFMSSIAKNP